MINKLRKEEVLDLNPKVILKNNFQNDPKGNCKNNRAPKVNPSDAKLCRANLNLLLMVSLLNNAQN